MKLFFCFWWGCGRSACPRRFRCCRNGCLRGMDLGNWMVSGCNHDVADAAFNPDLDVSTLQLKLGDVLVDEEFDKLSELFLIHEYSSVLRTKARSSPWK